LQTDARAKPARPDGRHRKRRLGTRLIVERVRLTNFRSYASLELDLRAGLVLAVGPNGAGKTNLLEALHVGTQGFSPRTRRESRLIRFEEDAAAVSVTGRRAETEVAVDVELRRNGAKRIELNRAPVRTMDELRGRVATLVFTPERLVVVKGSPAVRRAYFDRVLTRLLPARAALPGDYAAALTQRNAALRRVAAGLSVREALEPWTSQVAQLGMALSAAREEVVSSLQEPFRMRAAELRLAEARLTHEPATVTQTELEVRLERDLERGWTGAGPHLEDIAIFSGERDLRTFGSQGEQRMAVLSLLLAEAELLAERGPAAPLLLLDDVLSELDPERRAALARRIGSAGQALVTATSASALPVEPAQLVEIGPGSARSIS
jgi:DNA replication and repair protein RecF